MKLRRLAICGVLGGLVGAILLLLLWLPWETRTAVIVQVYHEDGHGVAEARVSLRAADGQVLGTGMTDQFGRLWGIEPWRTAWEAAGKTVNVECLDCDCPPTPVTISRGRGGSLRGWIPSPHPLDSTPHRWIRVEAKVVCRRHKPDPKPASIPLDFLKGAEA